MRLIINMSCSSAKRPLGEHVPASMMVVPAPAVVHEQVVQMREHSNHDQRYDRFSRRHADHGGAQCEFSQSEAVTTLAPRACKRFHAVRRNAAMTLASTAVSNGQSLQTADAPADAQRIPQRCEAHVADLAIFDG